MKIRSVLALTTLALAPFASAQAVDQVLVRAATTDTEVQEVTAEPAASQEDVAALAVNTEVVAEKLDRMLEQRFDRDGDIPQPAEALLVSN